jgi:hypothetical protein
MCSVVIIARDTGSPWWQSFALITRLNVSRRFSGLSIIPWGPARATSAVGVYWCLSVVVAVCWSVT